MKPLYLILYKSPNRGEYEYLCSYALYKLSNLDFEWSTTDEFLEKFNEQILEERQSQNELPYQLRLWVEDIPSLEKDLRCSYQAEPMEEPFLEIVKGQLEKTEKYPNDYLWHSIWFLVRKNDRVVVGSADFKDVPNTDQEVEIGYGLGKEFEHNGYMTEAVATKTSSATW